MWKRTGDPRYHQAVERYYKFYLENLINNDEHPIPKMTPDSLYPIDIHSCAEAILCNALLASDFEEARLLLPELYGWVASNMQVDAGWFIYRVKQVRSGERRLEVPYIRWGQAWMLLALVNIFVLC
jgi:hypothetical protein